MNYLLRLLLLIGILIIPLSAAAQDDTPQILIARYQATDLSDTFVQLAQNPWKFQGRQVYVVGLYFKHISPTRVIMLSKPGVPVVIETQIDLPIGPFIGCVGEVLGTVIIEPYQRPHAGEVPHIQTIECITDDFQLGSDFLTRMSTQFGGVSPNTLEFDELVMTRIAVDNAMSAESTKHDLQRQGNRASHQKQDRPSSPSPGKNRYLAMVQENIDHQWAAPPLVASTPVVVLKFRIARSGDISNIHIEESSGNGHYDSAAKQAVYAVNPLPPFPEDMSEPHVDVRFRFVKD